MPHTMSAPGWPSLGEASCFSVDACYFFMAASYINGMIFLHLKHLLCGFSVSLD